MGQNYHMKQQYSVNIIHCKLWESLRMKFLLYQIQFLSSLQEMSEKATSKQHINHTQIGMYRCIWVNFYQWLNNFSAIDIKQSQCSHYKHNNYHYPNQCWFMVNWYRKYKLWFQENLICKMAGSMYYGYGLAQNCSNSIANALELLQYCTKLPI